LKVTHDLVLKYRLAVGEFLDRLGRWGFTELLLHLLRDYYGKDVDGANWDILDTSSRTGIASGRRHSNWRSGNIRKNQV
jgi:hypothetical protein